MAIEWPHKFLLGSIQSMDHTTTQKMNKIMKAFEIYRGNGKSWCCYC